LRPIDGDRRFFEREAFLNQPVYNASSSARVSKFSVAVGPKPLKDIKARRIFVWLFVAVPGKEQPRVATPHEQNFWQKFSAQIICQIAHDISVIDPGKPGN
jgi:hypothetical protein